MSSVKRSQRKDYYQPFHGGVGARHAYELKRGESHFHGGDSRRLQCSYEQAYCDTIDVNSSLIFVVLLHETVT